VDVDGGSGLLVVLRRRRLLGDAAGGLGCGPGAGVRLLLTEERLHVASAAPRHGSGDLSPAELVVALWAKGIGMDWNAAAEEWGTMVDDWMVRGLTSWLYMGCEWLHETAAAVVRGDSIFLNFEMGVRASCHTVPSPSENPLTSGRPSVRRGLVAAKWNHLLATAARSCLYRVCLQD